VFKVDDLMLPLPRRFFVGSGKAVSQVSDLNAFDEALLEAGIGDTNIISVSSILPPDIKEVKMEDLPRGAIIHCVLAQQRGGEGEMITAGIGYAFRKDRQGGYVVEGHMHGTKRALKEILEWKLNGMAKRRGVQLGQYHYKIEELSIPMDHYGACIAALVYLV
jgi:arginine decarboxylase